MKRKRLQMIAMRRNAALKRRISMLKRLRKKPGCRCGLSRFRRMGEINVLF